MDFEDFVRWLLQAVISGRIEYCYTDYYSLHQMPPVTRLYGFRPWRVNQLIGTFNTLNEATDAAQKMGCEIGARHR